MKNILYRAGLVLFASTTTIHAEVKLDGSFGSTDSIAGPTYDIKKEYGQQRGTNLFHSFKYFDIGNGETASFRSDSSVSNIVARVTGGNASNIYGSIKVDQPGTNLWLMNPKGIIFGKGATIDINGAFHVGTGNSLNFGDVDKFDASSARDNQLSSQVPTGFSFSADTYAGNVVFNEVTLNTSTLTRLYVAAPSINLINSNLQIANGDIFLRGIKTGSASVDGTGKNTRDGSVLLSGTTLGVSDASARQIKIQGDQFYLKRSSLAITGAGADKNEIDLYATTLSMKKTTVSMVDNSSVGHTGKIAVNADLMEMGSDSSLRVDGYASESGAIDIDSKEKVIVDHSLLETNAKNTPADVDINAKELELRNAAFVHTASVANVAGKITLRGNQILVNSSSIVSDSTGISNGRIGIVGRNITLENNSTIKTFATKNSASAGVQIDGDQIAIDNSTISGSTEQGTSSGIAINAANDLTAKGDSQLALATQNVGGDISLLAKRIDIGGKTKIENTNDGNEKSGGKIRLNGNQEISLGGEDSDVTISSRADSVGKVGYAGSVEISAPRISSIGKVKILSRAGKTNGAGNISITSKDSLQLVGNDISITTPINGNGEIRITSSRGSIENTAVKVLENDNAIDDRIFIKFDNAPLTSPSVTRSDSSLILPNVVNDVESLLKSTNPGIRFEQPRVKKISNVSANPRVKDCNGITEQGNTISRVRDVSTWRENPGDYTLRRTNASIVNKLSRGAAMNVQTSFFSAGKC